MDTSGALPEWRSRFGAARVGQAQHLTAEVQNPTRSIEQIRSDDLNTAVRAFSRAEKIRVIGFGENYPLAHFARALLIRVKPDIRMIPIGGFSILEEFASIQASDAVLALGIARRMKSLRSVMATCRKAGAHLYQRSGFASGPRDVNCVIAMPHPGRRRL